MLTGVKNQTKVLLLSVKYNLMREMVNRVSFFTNVGFMMLNNATFIIQWIILFQIRDDFGGADFKGIMMLWAMAASTYGLSHILFNRAFGLSYLIMEGKLDAFLVQPKNVLISIISSETNASSIGDLMYGYLVVLIVKPSFHILFWYTLYTITGAIISAAVSVLFHSLSFWIVKSDVIADNINGAVIHLSTYPEGIFKGAIKFLIYSIVPVGLISYLPLRLMIQFDLIGFLCVAGFTAVITMLSFLVFYRGLRHYSSSNMMSAHV